MATKHLLSTSVVVLLVIGLAAVAYRFGREGSPDTPQAIRAAVSEQLSSLDGIEARLKRLEASGLSDKPPAEADSAKGQASADADRLAAIESSLATLLLRVKGLEEDPVRRGQSFLDAGYAEMRREGINLLRRIAVYDPKVRAQIRGLLQDQSNRVREQAAQILRDVKDKESAPEMKALLADPDGATRRRAVQGLVAIEASESSREIGRLLLSDSDERVRLAAADALGKLKAQENNAALIEALKDRSERVKGEAIISLGEMGDPGSAPHLRAIYDQDPGGHRIQLSVALKRLGDDEPLRSEINRLTEILKTETDQRIRQQAQQGLNALNRSAAR